MFDLLSLRDLPELDGIGDQGSLMIGETPLASKSPQVEESI